MGQVFPAVTHAVIDQGEALHQLRAGQAPLIQGRGKLQRCGPWRLIMASPGQQGQQPAIDAHRRVNPGAQDAPPPSQGPYPGSVPRPGPDQQGQAHRAAQPIQKLARDDKAAPEALALLLERPPHGAEQGELFAQVVLHHVAEPAQPRGVHHVPQPPCQARGRRGDGAPRRSRIHGDPACVAVQHLHPGVGVTVAHGQVVAVVVPGASHEAVDLPGVDARIAQEQGHGRGEVLAVTFPVFKEELVHRFQPLLVAQGGGVAVIVAQVPLHGLDLVVHRGLARDDLPGQGAHPPGHPGRHLQEA